MSSIAIDVRKRSKNLLSHLMKLNLIVLINFFLKVEGRGGIPGYRFTPSPSVFASVDKNPENACFCPHGPPCAPHGTFNVSLCQYGKSNCLLLNVIYVC